MNFQLTEEQQLLQENARKYAKRELPSIALELELNNKPPSKELIKNYAELGFLGINVPEELGGLGMGNLEALIVLEEFAKISSAIAFPVFESCVGPVRAIEHFGPAELVKKIVPAVCAGEKVIAVAMSEAQAGSALTDLTTTGKIDGEHVVINGAKRWCSGGGHADGYVVYCRLSKDKGARGIGAVYVDSDAEGLSFGSNEELMGFRGIPSADLFFDNVRMPTNHIIVPAGGFGKLMEAFDSYVQEREQFGKPIIDFQAVQLKIAEMQMRVDAARLLIYRAASNAQDGMPSIADSSIAKCFANEISREVTGTAMQLMGAYGYSKEFPMERRLRDAWGWGIAGGAIDIQKTNIASAIVGRRFNQRR